MARVLQHVALLLVAIGLATSPARAEPAAPDKPVIAIGEPAPVFLLKTLNPERCGQDLVSLKAWVGSQAQPPRRAVVLSFAASYCGPCRREMPELGALAARTAERGVAVAVVGIDKEPEGIEAFRRLVVDELALAVPVLLDRFAIVGRRYGASELPFLVLIDEGGKIRWFKSGYEEGGLAALAAELDKLVGPPPAPEGPAKPRRETPKKKGT